MATFVPQHLTLRSETFAIERHDTDEIVGSGDWVALVRGASGLTVIRTAANGADGWRAFEGDIGHELDVPGMLVSILSPLSEADLPVFAASTYNADLVLVPASSAEKAVVLLRAAGHTVTD
ncbi:ACT domain-containing protein [Cryptosporangium aurantiacum]|uniref:CASTOR ACT domain-containing protein n=1 Tax=Cryptosporangium aurantiacum TaxID=134849 RepID=A0A1M7R865_9ACTN|nr:ACT domain-containing protein [Cryptosporangium aurantiacum]SHN42446.1 hypothetical protein SAMN05443668_108212 [Cryptosporangium aurantiacum]